MVNDLARRLDRLRDELRTSFPGIQATASSMQAPDEMPPPPAERVVLARGLTRPSLFDYQEELVDAILLEARSGARLLLSLPTGAGKTRTGVTAALRAMAQMGRGTCAWLAPSVELVDQAFAAFESTWASYGAVPDMTLMRGISNELSTTPCAVVLLTPQMAYARLKQGESVGGWDLVVFDEAHQLGARTFKAATEAATAGVGGLRAPLVGLSATPGRVSENETEDLVSLFGGRLLKSRILGKDPVRALQRRGVLAELQFRQLTHKSIAATDEAQRLAVAARACAELSRRGRRILVFAASVAGATVLAEALRSLRVPAGVVHAGSSSTERRQAISDFEHGDTPVLTNQRVLATGYDCPAVTDVMILSKVSSPILFEQIVGRAARGPRTGGWRAATVWDFDNHLALHGRPQSYYRYRDYDWS